MREPLTAEQIRQMFRDFGLADDTERLRLVDLASVGASGVGDSRTLVFLRVANTSEELGDSDAKLAEHP